MGRLERILLFFVALVALFFSAAIMFLLYPVEPITVYLQQYQRMFPTIGIVLAGFCAVLCLIFFLLVLLALFFPKRTDTLTFFAEKSRLEFSRRAVESAVRCSFQDVSGVNFAKIRVKIHRQPEKTRVFVKLSAENSCQLLNLSEIIKEKIEAELQASLRLTVRSVDIKITGVNQEYKKQLPKQDATAEHARVV